MNVRALTESGLADFAAYLVALKADPRLPLPAHLLTDRKGSESIPGRATVELRTFATRFDLAAYLHERLANRDIPHLDRHRGLWTWLTLLYFDQLCPANGRGERKVGESARYVPVFDNWRKFYRHLLVSPFRIYRIHADDAEVCRGLLSNPPSSPGELFEQIASRQELVSNRFFLELVNQLYFDMETNVKRKGITSDKGGSPRRLAEVHAQFELTFDLPCVEASNMQDMLPREFNRFRR